MNVYRRSNKKMAGQQTIKDVKIEDKTIDFLIKLRDAAQTIVDATNSQLELSNPFNLEELSYDTNKIPWIRTQGQKGPYERYPAFQQKPTISADYVNLLEDLKRHEGKLQKAGLFYWTFEDNTTIGRKPAKR